MTGRPYNLALAVIGALAGAFLIAASSLASEPGIAPARLGLGQGEARVTSSGQSNGGDVIEADGAERHAPPAQLSNPRRAPMVFSDDFEAFGDLSRWGGTEDQLLVIEEDIVFDGKFAARATSTGERPAYMRKQLPAPQSEVFYRLRFNIIEQGPNPVKLLRLLTPDRRPVLSVTVGQTGLLGYENDVTGTAVFGNRTILPGDWHEVQVHVRVDGADSVIEVWLDDNPIEALGTTTWLGEARINRLEIGDSTAARNYDVVFDDIAIDTRYIEPSRGADPVAGNLTVRAIPPQAGLAFGLDGRTFLTDEQGIARIEVERWSWDLRQRIKGIGAPTSDGGYAEFGSWYNWTGPHDHDLVATFNLSYPVTWHFIDLQGNPVDPGLVSSFTVKSSTGVVETYSVDQQGQSHLLQATAVAPRSSGREKALSYSVESVIVGGSNVVHRAQQRFFPAFERSWEVQLLFYSVSFRGRDAFFGSPIGQTVQIQYPDGQIRQVPLRDDGRTDEILLPRGEFQVRVRGTGFSPPQPIALSRDQTIDLEVISYLDLALAFTLAASTAIGLVVLGRTRVPDKARRLLAQRRLGLWRIHREARP